MNNITAAKKKDAPPISVRYFAKMKGKGRSPLQVNIKDSLTGLLGGFLTILTLTYLTSITSTELLMAPFGASCVLAFGVWNAPLSQPRNIIGGHLISTFIGLSIYHLFGNEYWTVALAVGMSIAIMMLTRTTHPSGRGRSNCRYFRSIQLELFSNTSFSWFSCYCSYCFIH